MYWQWPGRKPRRIFLAFTKFPRLTLTHLWPLPRMPSSISLWSYAMVESSAFTEQAKCSDEWDNNTYMQDWEECYIFTLCICMIILLFSMSARTSVLLLVNHVNKILSGSEHCLYLFRKLLNFWSVKCCWMKPAADETSNISCERTGALESFVQLAQSFF